LTVHRRHEILPGEVGFPIQETTMNGFRIAAAAIALMAASAIAQAAETTGTIEDIDPNGRTMMLDDGVTYQLDEAVDAEGLKTGDKVMVTYEQADGKIMVSAVSPAE
jgi:Cu/Ag efflux protein CusF